MPPAAESLPVENRSAPMGPPPLPSSYDNAANATAIGAKTQFTGTKGPPNGAKPSVNGAKQSPKNLSKLASAVSCLDVSFSFNEGLSSAGEATLAALAADGLTAGADPVSPATDGAVDAAVPSTSSGTATSARPAQQAAAKRPSSWQVEPSELCLRTVNPIRKITDAAPAPAPSASAPATSASAPAMSARKSTISLGQGDPTVFGHLAVSQEAAEAVAEALLSGRVNGYTPSFGLPEARQAVATYLSSLSSPTPSGRTAPPSSLSPSDVSATPPSASRGAASSTSGEVSALPSGAARPPPLSPSNVYITSGCGHSFQLCLEALSNPGKNVLLPRPGFPVYDCWCAAAGVEIRRYSLLPEKDWEVDLEEVRQLADENTVAILICHPGNPCGNVFSKEHLREILGVAESLKLPIISDEIYGGISFHGAHFTPTVAAAAEPMTPQPEPVASGAEQSAEREGSAGAAGTAGETGAAESSGEAGSALAASGEAFSVPVFTVSSISKTLLVPGWRLGWIAVHDPKGILKASRVQEALENRLQFTTLTCSLIQAALPRILLGIKADFFLGLNASLEDSLQLSLERIASIPGLDCPSQPQGGMFLMVRVDLNKFSGFESDVAWCRALLQEESVVVIPGTAFEFPGWFRTLISAPRGILEEAWERIAQFCARHHNSTAAQ